MQIGFDNKRYDLNDSINVDATRLQASIIKGNSTMETIVNDAKNAETIYIYDDEDKLIGQYIGYDKPIAFTLYIIDGIDIVSVELNNTDYDATLSSLRTIVDTHEEAITDLASEMDVVDTHSEEIESINESVSHLTFETDMIDNQVKELNESQLSQDAAIEDLAEGMAEMMEG